MIIDLDIDYLNVIRVLSETYMMSSFVFDLIEPFDIIGFP